MTTRIAFSGAFLVFSILYTVTAFELDFRTQGGRIGPGFFPRVLGVMLIVTSAYAVVRDRGTAEEEPDPAWRTTAAVIGLTGLFVASLTVLGGLGAMVAYMAVMLWLLNRRHPVQNVLISILLPAALYLMFDVWLNAAMPRGLVP